MKEKTVQFIQKEPAIWGPIFLLCSVALAVKTSISFDLLLLAVGGFFLSARLQIRGCCYALSLLGIVSVLRHLFLVSDHLWALGIEGLLGMAFLITALASEQGASWIQILESQIETRKSALENLEEEKTKEQSIAQEQQIAFQEKVASLQKELDEMQAEHSSLLILNEVLRKSNARYVLEAAQFEEALYGAKIEWEQLKAESLTQEMELGRLKNTEGLARENIQLLNELNRARYDREQTYLINETLARLYAKESFKAKDAEGECASLKELLRAVQGEIRKESFDPQMAEKLRFAEEKVHQLSKIEPLFKQLREQFEEKTRVLHQTRSDLFKLDTELQRVQREKATLELEPIPKEVEKELDTLTSHIQLLEDENRELQEIVTLLTELEKRKKKVKTAPLPSDQSLLF